MSAMIVARWVATSDVSWLEVRRNDNAVNSNAQAEMQIGMMDSTGKAITPFLPFYMIRDIA